MEAAQLPRTLSDVDFAVINGNYAATAGFSASKDALAVENATSEAAQTYTNLLVVEEGNENEPAIKALVAALTSQTVKDYIDSTYDGAVVWFPSANTAQFPPCGLSTAPAAAARHLRCQNAR